MASLLDLAEARLRGLLDIPTRAARAVVNPTVFSGLLGSPTLPREQGFAEAAFGLPARENMSVLDPTAASYMQGYSAGEPMAYLGMATPFAAPAAVAGAKAVAPKAGMALENYMAAQGLLQPLTAYHGTPHNIQGKFDISKVGTGEGAQAFGHGMYFAENPKVAEEYKKILSEAKFVSNGKDLKDMPSSGGFAPMMNEMKKNGKSDQEIIDTLRKISQSNHPNAKSANSLANKLESNKLAYQQSGNLYKVDIPDEYIPNMLDWDKPLNMQTPEVLKSLKIPQEAVDKYNKLSNRLEELQWQRGGLDSPEWEKVSKEAVEIRAKYGLHRSGEEVYREVAQLAKDMGNQNFSQVAAENLKRQGISGIRYLDEGSRGKARNQTSNFVVFDPSEVKILEKNKKKIEGLLD